MLTVYHRQNQSLLPAGAQTSADLAGAVWLDLLDLTKEEESKVEAALGIDVPTREEMQEIEVSNRLYSENNAITMTVTVVTRLDSEVPLSSPITFILTGEKLVTVRYAEPHSFKVFAARAKQPGNDYTTGQMIFIGLMEAIINRLADSIESSGADLDTLSRETFHTEDDAKKRDFQEILRKLGHMGSLSSKILETLTSIARAVHFLHETIDFSHLANARDIANRMKAIDKDILSLNDHVGYLGSKISFLLDATLGLISIEQNNVFKIFSIATVSLMPPTLIGAIYGMNFRHMPELDWAAGYPLALGLMAVSAIIPLLYFRRRGWL